MEKFKLIEFTQQGELILSDVIQEFKSLQFDESNLPKKLLDENAAVKLVFIGQYSAGKSSIIKMLTGEDVAVGADITTQNTGAYSWNSLEIIDTPGIHTGVRPDHDKITYEQINKAAMLIFVITCEGFDRTVGNHFRQLAVEQKRGGNMVLVVNKMDRTSLGNTQEQQEIISTDLIKIIEPYTAADLYLSFLSTEDYFEAISEDDEEMKAELLDRSGYNVFVNNLNKFVAEHEILAQIIAPLYTIANEIRLAIQNTTLDRDAVALEETINHRKSILVEGKESFFNDAREIANQCKNEISQIGRQAVDDSINSGSQDKAKKIIEDANAKISKLAKSYGEQIGESFQDVLSRIIEDVNIYDNSILVKQVNENIAIRVKKEADAGRIVAGGATATIGALTVVFGGQVASKFAVPATQIIMQTITQEVPSAFGEIAGGILGKVTDVATTAALAGEIGPFAKLAGSKAGDGVNFLISNTFTDTITQTVPKTITLPASATNKIAGFISQNAAKIGVAISVLGAAWSIYSIIKSKEEQEKQAAEQLRIRNENIKLFDDIANEVNKQLIERSKNLIGANIEPIITECDAGIEKLHETEIKFNLANKNLIHLLERTEKLIAEIQTPR